MEALKTKLRCTNEALHVAAALRLANYGQQIDGPTGPRKGICAWERFEKLRGRPAASILTAAI